MAAANWLYCPSLHGVQASPVLAWYWPIAQSVHDVAGATAYWPLPHSVQLSALNESLNCPCGHASQLTPPAP